tara:strand:- start:581 stop:898 length:318 start_codon:yes stop_codon:yes gene_type:complete
MEEKQNIIIYNTADGKASVSLFAKDGNVWMNQNQLAELFDTSVPNISMHVRNILKDRELDLVSVVKQYKVTFFNFLDNRAFQVIFNNFTHSICFKIHYFGKDSST